ncbi:MAG: hypothetical protein RLY70_1015, partial [Planctomycetota bacterium]
KRHLASIGDAPWVNQLVRPLRCTALFATVAAVPMADKRVAATGNATKHTKSTKISDNEAFNKS